MTCSNQVKGEALSEIRPGTHHLICPTRSFRQFKKEEIEQSIPKRFEQQVAQYPQRLAVQTRKNRLTYQALNQYSNRIAHAILEKRGKGEEPVALLLDQGAPLIAAILGSLKAGKIYLPIDPLDPKSRIEDVLEDARTNLVICQNLRSLFNGRGILCSIRKAEGFQSKIIEDNH